MQRVISVSLLLLFAVFSLNAFAQRSGNAAPPQNTPWAGIPLLSVPQPTVGAQSSVTGIRTLGRRPLRHHRPYNGGILLPYGYAEPYWYDASEYEPVSASPTVVVIEKDREPAKPLVVPPASPQLIDVPRGMVVSKAVPSTPATIFILVNGERLESRRYVLTANQLEATINGQQRTVPTSSIDSKATIAANQERGIELLIPGNRSAISISF